MTIMQKVLEEHLLNADSNLYGIYRLRKEEDTFQFRNLDFFRQKGIVPRWEQYTPVYIGELAEDTGLEDIWDTLNVNHPDDYFTYSLSVGDVVVLRRGANLSAHFVDSIGYTELPDFLPKKQTDPATPPMVKCLACGKEQEQADSELYCSRCSALMALLGGGLTLDNLATHFWEECFACGADIISVIDLAGDNLIIQCDNCGETHVIPFAPEDLIQYIRSGIVRENVEE